ncbi:MAG: tetratricopeptide repeat protein [Gammaproteobacteria bacterium]
MRQIERAKNISDRLVAWNMLESASSVLERVLEKHPYQPELLRRLGRIRLAQGLPHEAIPLLKLAIAHDQQMEAIALRGASAPVAPQTQA